MTRRREDIALAQMLDFARALLRATYGRTRAELQADEMLQLAVERLLEKLGEASRRVPEKTRNAHPEVPWRQIAGMRNRLIHVYDRIDYVIVWDTVQADIPKPVEQLERMLR